MLRSMFSAISGLKAHQTKMDVTGNNIANVNTVGFKSSQTVFQDTLSQVIRAGGAPAADRGGTNPAQVGLGAKVAAITTNWTQGATQSTGRSTDFMIEGDGFFVTRGAGGEQLFTRAGSFDFDASGKLVTPDGAILRGWMADADGNINPNGPIGDLSVPYGQVVNPVATTAGSVLGNLSAEGGDPVQTSVTMYDSLGVAQNISYTFTKSAAPAVNTWSLAVAHASNAEPPVITPLSTETVTFGADGTLSSAPTVTVPLAALANPSWTGNITLDLETVTQLGGKSNVKEGGQDGFALGTLQSFGLSNDGTIMGVYSNGLRQPLGQLALASFNNPGGLEKAGSSTFRVGDNSGAAAVGLAGVGGRGLLVSGALEMSNVDLAEEFTGLIVAQRGFQANSRVITSSDEILQDLVNLKR
ncbi:flagellar hook protein FlgE [Blastococcus haudaquaticus]|uniref:Flagellar hook protein FlgE n=1 Tax=Blastococcus haudaquaticus TaxID=1938745 RepID=A0A286H062_9ACTN|nr:flagellar hook protein FlgE [Blastococcus haudaquaticus]SOE01165.1 flagellar hook protein FlgE [Blastococcus haudaquaticus]